MTPGNPLYIVVSHSGAYSDYFESIVGVYSTLDAAKRVGQADLAASYPELGEWKHDEKHNLWSLSPATTRYMGDGGCFIETRELDREPEP